MQPLPIGIQDFAKLRSEGFIYVDKTEYIYSLMQVRGFQFIARPRRFGKSLVVNTMKEIFSGNRALFQGLWIEDKIDWEPRPVILLDMNGLAYHKRPLETVLGQALDEIAAAHGLSATHAESSKEKFIYLLKAFAAQGRKAAVLIDEYDKPITDYLGEDDRLKEHIPILKQLYSVLKSFDAYIHFAFITGVSKFGKVSIFSDLNNLNDLSLDRRFFTLFGYTRQELESYFPEHIARAASIMGMTVEQVWQGIRYWYNGYSFDGNPETSVCNPFSLLNFFDKPEFRGYWFDTGTPTFLTKLLRDGKLPAYELERLNTNELGVQATDLYNISAVSLLFQTGYLTVLQKESDMYGVSYVLGYPNEEVRQAFNAWILAEYTSRPVGDLSSFEIAHLRHALILRNWDDFFDIIRRIFATVPYQIADRKESYFHSVMHVLLTATGWRTFSEVATNRGRMDTVLENRDTVCIFEFKVRESAASALEQIHSMGYAERFGKAHKSLILIGVAYDAEALAVKDWVVEEVRIPRI